MRLTSTTDRQPYEISKDITLAKGEAQRRDFTALLPRHKFPTPGEGVSGFTL